MAEFKPNRDRPNPIVAGEVVPSVKISLKGEDVSMLDFFKSSTGLIFGVAGAFSHHDTTAIILPFKELSNELRKYVNFIGCVSVNDPFVLKAWAKSARVAEEFTFIADVNGYLTRRLGMGVDLASEGFGRARRCRRFAMIIGAGSRVLWTGFNEEALARCVLSQLERLKVVPGSKTTGSFDLVASPRDDDVRPKSQDENRPKSYKHNPMPPHAGPHWDYRNDQGRDWQANPELCAGSSRQSPIAIFHKATADGAKNSGLFMHYTDVTGNLPQKYKIINNGHSIQVEGIAEVGDNSTLGHIVVDNETYKVSQFHFHAPSEHTIDGTRGALELHIVHTNIKDPKSLCVLGVLFETGGRDQLLASLFDLPSFPPAPNTFMEVARKHVTGGVFDLSHFAYDDIELYRYNGSLTTPPCTENVKWFVTKEPVFASDEQIRVFAKLFLHEGTQGNYRCLQNTPDNARNDANIYRVKGSLMDRLPN